MTEAWTPPTDPLYDASHPDESTIKNIQIATAFTQTKLTDAGTGDGEPKPLDKSPFDQNRRKKINSNVPLEDPQINCTKINTKIK